MVLQLLPYLAIEIFYSFRFFLWAWKHEKRDSWECHSLAVEIFACLCARRIENYAQTTFIDFSQNINNKCGISDLMGFVIALRDFFLSFLRLHSLALLWMFGFCLWRKAFNFKQSLSVKVKAGKKERKS